MGSESNTRNKLTYHGAAPACALERTVVVVRLDSNWNHYLWPKYSTWIVCKAVDDPMLVE